MAMNDETAAGLRWHATDAARRRVVPGAIVGLGRDPEIALRSVRPQRHPGLTGALARPLITAIALPLRDGGLGLRPPVGVQRASDFGLVGGKPSARVAPGIALA